MALIRNPILPGFYPDPSFLRVGDDYYIASSTFEWFPGVALHHSRDLVHWRQIGHALTRRSQLDLKGVANSGGIWAPCLSFAGGSTDAFHLIFTNVTGVVGDYKDSHNYLVTAPSIEGPWSEPVYLNSSGFDPSLFHDDDGRKWLVNMIWDHRKGTSFFQGILLQEYSPTEKRLVGPIRNIFRGTRLGVTEGPHLYKRNGWYYLMVAEGGTTWDHAVTIARSTRIEGPYEVDPAYPLLTSAGHPELTLQKAGHASLVETQTGELYLAHPCGRPIGPHRRCILGRETALQRCLFTEDGWLRLATGGRLPEDEVAAPALPPHAFPQVPERDDFDGLALGVQYQTLRIPADPSWLSLGERPSHMRLRGAESPMSEHRQSLVARRVQHFRCEAETSVEFEPDTVQQMAGLVCWYDTDTHYYLAVTYDNAVGKCLHIFTSDKREYGEAIPAPVPVAQGGKVFLRASIEHEDLRFSYSLDGSRFEPIGPVLDMSKLSDEYNWMAFTGAFVGMAAHDMSGGRRVADFDYFAYRERGGGR